MTSYRVIYAFEGRDEGELTVNENDIIEAHESPEDGWVNATNLSNGSTGFVPENYLEILEPAVPNQGPPPPPPPPPAMPCSPIEHLSVNQQPPQYAPQHEIHSNSGSGNSDFNRNVDQNSSYQDSIPVGADCSSYQNKNLDVNRLDRRASSSYSSGTLRTIGDAYKIDPIKNIVGSTMMGKFKSSGVENFMVGLATGKNMQSGIMYDKMETRVVGDPENCRWEVEDDEIWKVQVIRTLKDDKHNVLFELKADPCLPQRFGMPSEHSIKRKLTDCHWLDKRLRVKYPFIYIPPVSKDDVKGIQLNHWFDYICQHPVIRNSHYMKLFMSITDKQRFREAKRNTEAGKNQDKNLKEEMLLQIKVSTESKINEDLTSVMADIKKSTEDRQLSYAQTTNQFGEFVKNSAACAHNQNMMLHSFQKRMNEFSQEQQKIQVMGSDSMAEAARSTVNDLSKIMENNDEKMTNSSQFTNKHITYSQCTSGSDSTAGWNDEGGYMMDQMIKRYTAINSKKTEQKLNRESFANAKERTKNLIAIHEAEHHHQLKMNNKVIKESMFEYLRLHTRYLETELETYKKMMATFENIQIPESE